MKIQPVTNRTRTRVQPRGTSARRCSLPMRPPSKGDPFYLKRRMEEGGGGPGWLLLARRRAALKGAPLPPPASRERRRPLGLRRPLRRTILGCPTLLGQKPSTRLLGGEALR